ncbi:MAG: hypothetical protein FD169_1378 [Bacillota bacterium]|nr:MAG: hypothetical protein FD169_1378 [Bacillota bacterium]
MVVIFSAEEQKKLLENESVLRAAGTRITCTPEFKCGSVRRYIEEDKTPLCMCLFLEAAFDLDIICHAPYFFYLMAHS